MKTIRQLITLLEQPSIQANPRKTRMPSAEFAQLAVQRLGSAKASYMSFPEIFAFAESQGVQIPVALRVDPNYKVDSDHWKLV